MVKSGEKLEKVGKGGKSGLKWGKVGKSGEKLEKLGKVGKGGEKCGKWRKVAKSWKKLEKVVKSGEKWGRWENVLFKKFWMSENNFRSQFLPFQIDTQLCFFLKFLDKMAAGGHFGLTTMSVIELVRDIWMNNACVKFEERSLNPSKVIALTTK